MRAGYYTKKMRKDRWLYIMLLPGILYFIIFKYIPMAGVSVAFQDYSPFLGFGDSPWVGWKHFERLFSDQIFYMLIKNTFLLSIYNILFAFPMPIIVALMLNELRKEMNRRFIQTMIYIPHFMSWAIVVGMFYVLFEMQDGLIQSVIRSLGFESFTIMMDPDKFRAMYVVQEIWRDTGWGTIIYLAALAGVDPQLYEAAKMDGAGRWRQMWHVTLPSIQSVIVILFILRLGDILELGFDHVFLLINPLTREVGEIFDTYQYDMGIRNGQFSYTTAIGIFKSGIGLILIMAANTIAKRFGEEGIY